MILLFQTSRLALALLLSFIMKMETPNVSQVSQYFYIDPSNISEAAIININIEKYSVDVGPLDLIRGSVVHKKFRAPTNVFPAIQSLDANTLNISSVNYEENLILNLSGKTFNTAGISRRRLFLYTLIGGVSLASLSIGGAIFSNF